MTDDLTRLKGTPSPGEIAGRNTDPRFYLALGVLPNPDPILRRAGKSEEVFDAIESDAHVIGELRAIKADLLRFKHSLTPGGDRRVDKRAYELCQAFLACAPAPLTTWADVAWNTGKSTFRGLSVHEIVWSRQGDLIMPEALLDRPKRRFMFNGEGQLRVLTRDDPLLGVPAEELYFLVDRHMPSYDNPYGTALFSACYWPYVFKHGGFRWLVKFCERNGIPFPVGKYPVGSNEAVKTALSDALENLIEAGYAALEDGGAIELLESAKGGGGKLAQHQLIDVCNAEMSKALTSQTLATEQTGGTGARAASESHADRAAGVNDGDRERIALTWNKLWTLITRLNLGEDAAPPTSSFIGEADGTLPRARVYQIFINSGGEPSRKAMAADLGITLADANDPADQMRKPATPPAPGAVPPGPAEFAAATAGLFPDRFPDQDALDAVDLDAQLQPIAQQMLQPILERLRKGMTPEEIKGQLGVMYAQIDDRAIAQLVERAVFVSLVWGRLTAGQ